MARSSLTLAASVTAALPGAVAVGAAPLSEGAVGRYDTAAVHLADGREVVVRMPVGEEAAAELAAQSRALQALTAGVRALLPFRAPEVLGETGSGMTRALVVDRIDGYRIDPTHLPSGRGFAPAVGGALAAVHTLPASIVRTDGLPVRTPDQVHDDVARLLDRAEATRRVPDILVDRWRQAVDTPALWRFDAAVILGGATSASIVLTDDGDRVEVVGILDWDGLSVGDPATDLRWLASAPAAADDVYAGYVDAATRAPDALLRERARFYAELEFAKWLVHGHEAGDEEVMADAVSLLDALAEGVRGDRIVPDAAIDIDAALAFAERMPERSAEAPDTSMQTDAYDPAMVSLFLAAERDRGEVEDAPRGFDLAGLKIPEPEETQPIDLTGWSIARTSGADPVPAPAPADDDAEDLERQAERASQAALRRWSEQSGPRLSSGG